MISPGSDFVRAANRFSSALRHAKEKLQPRDFDWYAHDSISTILYQLAPLLADDASNVMDREKSLPVLDIGCGDGSISFFFESLGFRVTAVDCESTNCNQMKGVRALKAALNSSIDIRAQDLDSLASLPSGAFGIALLCGVLYHLKNPFWILERLAHRAHYCFLTTRIAQRTPRGTDISQDPLAYLVEPGELNGDPTNYWIFSEPGLRRLVTRAGWAVCRFHATGFHQGSDLSPQRDQRACYLLRSPITCGSRVSLLSGWHELERGGFRWTERRFRVLLRQPVHPGARLNLSFVLAPELVAMTVTLSASANGLPLPSATYSAADENFYTAELPKDLHGQQELDIEFVSDQALRSDADSRELSLIISFRGDPTDGLADCAPIEII